MNVNLKLLGIIFLHQPKPRLMRLRSPDDLSFLQRFCHQCRRSFPSLKALKAHATSCTWCASCRRWADERHVLKCEYANEKCYSSKRPAESRLLCNICGKFTTRNCMRAHMTGRHSQETSRWRRSDHPEVLSEVSLIFQPLA